MKKILAAGLLLFCGAGAVIAQTQPPVPEPLRAWEGWALWKDPHRTCPTSWQDATRHFCFWPSALELDLDATGGTFSMGATLYSESWLYLPGNEKTWPSQVMVNGAVAPVLMHDKRPGIYLAAGEYNISGRFVWDALPQNVQLPRETGIVRMRLAGREVQQPNLTSEGLLWLRRERPTESAEQDFISSTLYAQLSDGIPLWLDLELELIVSGKSREEYPGLVLPEGWTITQVESPIPVAVDGEGMLKAQVRAGRWIVKLRAFRLDNPGELKFARKPLVDEVLLGFQANPEFRMVEITGAPIVDVSQTQYPSAWRGLPVYRWQTDQELGIEERMRGMGDRSPQALEIKREWWLGADGEEFTFRDRISGSGQVIWRLDAAPGQDIGSVRAQGEGQLITLNPETGVPGVEIRSRALDLEATGTVERGGELSASGWLAPAEGVETTLHLPPGWRLFAVFGADWVRGDWLTAWSLLDLFLSLVFALAVFRLAGWRAALLAYAAYVLAYHEAGSPRYMWLVVLIPIALLRVVPEGWIRRALHWIKWATAAVLIALLIPFIAGQLQQMLFPQLEPVTTYAVPMARADSEDAPSASYAPQMFESSVLRKNEASKQVISNLAWDTKARIQTGPGVPEWTWRRVSFGWNGPVAASQTVHPWLIPPALQRGLLFLRVALLIALAVVLLRPRRVTLPPPLAGVAGVLLMLAVPASAQESFPSAQLLDELRERLTEPSAVFPNAAQIAFVELQLNDRNLTMDAEIHVGARVAVPLPGTLPTWSPVSVQVDNLPSAALRREDGFLWVVLDKGVHQVRVQGQVGDVAEWEWSFLLPPRRVSIDAPAWTVTGVLPDGVPERQIFFTRQKQQAATEAAYDRADFPALVQVERRIELGLVWQVRTTVTRLSPTGKAVSLRVPLLPGEKVLNTNATVRDGVIDVRMGAQEKSYAWESELAQTESLHLRTSKDDSWVERWELVVSPVWNTALEGLPPVFTGTDDALLPVWNPWPGESATIHASRPEAVPGATVTINNVRHEMHIGRRQHSSDLSLNVRASLGEDFPIALPSTGEITRLSHAGRELPVRKDGDQVVVALTPGDQEISLSWRMNEPPGTHVKADAVTLPVESANVTTILHVPNDQWVLWAHGPLRGPAVRFWVILLVALMAAAILSRTPHSPLRFVEWALLAIGLTQVPLPAALVVVGWLYLLVWRGHRTFLALPATPFNQLQLGIALATFVALIVLIAVVAAGLLGNPEMFIKGNNSSRYSLQWFLSGSDNELPQPGAWMVSIWWYRLLMLAWALWLAASLIRWLRWGWDQFSKEALWKRKIVVPPPVPPTTP